jgi:hypothetical protein
MYNTNTRALITGIAMVLATGTAHATEDFCAVVLKPPAKVMRDKGYNPNGWLALRQGPGTRYDIITTLREGDFLEADTAIGDHSSRILIHPHAKRLTSLSNLVQARALASR